MVPKCSDVTWRENNGDYGDKMCGTDWDGSNGPDTSTMSFEENCKAGILTAHDGCSSASTPFDDGPGSLYTNPGSNPYKLEEGYQGSCTWVDGRPYCENFGG